MDPIILICIVVLTCFFCAFLVYAILILIEIQKILKDARITLEEFAKRIEKINATIDNVVDFTNSITSKLMFITSGKAVLAGIAKTFNFFKDRKEKNKEV